MLDKLSALVARFDEVEARLSAPGLYDDPAAAAKLLKERNRLSPSFTPSVHARMRCARSTRRRS